MGKELSTWVPFRKRTIKILTDYNFNTKEVNFIHIALNDIFSKTILENILASGVIEKGLIRGKYLFAPADEIKAKIFEDQLLNVGLSDDQKRLGSNMIDILVERAAHKSNIEINFYNMGVEPQINDDLTVSWDNLCKVLSRSPQNLYQGILKLKKTLGNDLFPQHFIKTGSGKYNDCYVTEFKITQYGLNLLAGDFKFFQAHEKLQAYNKAFSDKQQNLIEENNKLKSMAESSRTGFTEKIVKISELSGKKIKKVMKEVESSTGINMKNVDKLPIETFNVVNKAVDKMLNNLEYWESVRPV